MGDKEKDPLPYDNWVEEALRGVVKRALDLTAEQGLPGEHHYYITFDTNHDGVEIPKYLHAEHPDNMTIVLQHQFEGLAVGEDHFDVALRFSGKLEHLRVPFSAISSFADPSVSFGLQLKITKTQTEAGKPALVKELKANGGGGEATGPAQKEKETKTGEVIALDSFRKK